MKSFSHIGDPYGFSKPDEAYVPPQRIISLYSRITGAGYSAPTSVDVSWNGSLIIVPTFDPYGGSSIINLPPLKDIPNGWYVSFLAMEYSNTTAQIQPGTANDQFGINNYGGTNDSYYLHAGAITTFIAVDFNLVGGGEVFGGTPIQGGSYPASKKRWITASSLGHMAHIGGSIPNVGASTYNRTTYDSVIIGGSSNRIDAQYGFIGQGANNVIANGGSSAFIGGGSNHTINSSTSRGTIINGLTNVIQSGVTDGVVLSGSTNRINGNYGAAIAGRDHYDVGEGSTFLNGQYSHSNALKNYIMFTSGIGLVYGSAGSSKGLSNIGLIGLAKKTTDATTTALAVNTAAAGSDNQLIFHNNTLARHIRGSVVAMSESAGNATKAWEFTALARRIQSGNVALIGTPVINVIAGDSGTSAWSITVTADTTNQAIAVNVTGAAATTIRWNCRLDLVDVGI